MSSNRIATMKGAAFIWLNAALANAHCEYRVPYPALRIHLRGYLPDHPHYVSSTPPSRSQHKPRPTFHPYSQTLLTHPPGVTSNFIFDGRLTGEFEYVRSDPFPRTPSPPPTNLAPREISPISSPSTSDPETLFAYPNTDPTSKDLICGRNASTPRAGTKTATVRAGSKVGFFVGRGITAPPTLVRCVSLQSSAREEEGRGS